MYSYVKDDTSVLLPFKQDHIEGYLELSAKTKTYFATAVNLWDAEYYIKVDDDVHVNIGNQIFFVIIFNAILRFQDLLQQMQLSLNVT